MISLEELEGVIERVSAGKATVQDIQALLRAISTVGLRQGQTATVIKNAEDITKYVQDLEKYVKDNKKTLSEIRDLDKDLLNLYESAAGTAKEKIEETLAEENVNKEELKKYQKVFRYYKDLARKQQNHLISIEKGREATDRMLQATIGLSTEWNKISAGGFLKGFTKQLRSALTLSNVLATAAKGLVETGLALDNAGAQLFKSTGIEKSRNNIEKSAQRLGSLGVGMKEKVAESTSALFSALKGYNDLTDLQTMEMEDVITLLGERNVSKTAAAESMVFLQRTLGKTPEAAAHSMLQMSEFADSIGRPIEEMVHDFAKAAPTLAMYGSESEKIFKGLSLEAQNLNMELTEVLSLGLTMDSFEGAAKAAQNFNLAFGGPFLSAQALMAASVEDKYKMIAQAYRESGADLSRREISGLARDAGIDEQKLMQILNREEANIKKPAAAIKSSSELMKSQMQKITRNLSLDTTLKMALEKLYMELFNLIGGKEGMMAIMKKVISGLDFVARNIKEIFAAMVGMKVISSIVKAKGILYPMRVINIGFGGRAGASKTAGAAATAASASRNTGIRGAATAAKLRIMRNPVGAALGALSLGAAGYGLSSMLGGEEEGASSAPMSRGSSTPMVSPPSATPSPSIPAPRGGGATPRPTGMSPAAAQPAGNVPSVSASKEDDFAGGLAINMKMGSSNSTSRVTTSNKSSQYIIPTFNKNDKIYPIIAAKPGGDIISSLTELEEAVAVLHDALKNSKSDLSIEGKELVRAFKSAYNEYG